MSQCIRILSPRKLHGDTLKAFATRFDDEAIAFAGNVDEDQALRDW